MNFGRSIIRAALSVASAAVIAGSGVVSVPVATASTAGGNVIYNGGVNVTTLPMSTELSADGTATASFIVNFSGLFSSNHEETIRGLAVSLPISVSQDDISWTLKGVPGASTIPRSTDEVSDYVDPTTNQVDIPLSYADSGTAVALPLFEDSQAQSSSLLAVEPKGQLISKDSNAFGLAVAGPGTYVVQVDVKVRPNSDGTFPQVPIRAEWVWKCNSESANIGSFENGCQSLLDFRDKPVLTFEKAGQYVAEDYDENGIYGNTKCKVTNNLTSWETIGRDLTDRGASVDLKYGARFALESNKDIYYVGVPYDEDSCDTGLAVVDGPKPATEPKQPVSPQCVAAAGFAALPILIAIPVVVGSYLHIPGLEALSGRVDGAIRDINNRIQHSLGIENPELQRLAYQWNVDLAALARPASQFISTTGFLAIIGAVIGIVVRSCVPTASAGTTEPSSKALS